MESEPHLDELRDRFVSGFWSLVKARQKHPLWLPEVVLKDGRKLAERLHKLDGKTVTITVAAASAVGASATAGAILAWRRSHEDKDTRVISGEVIGDSVDPNQPMVVTLDTEDGQVGIRLVEQTLSIQEEPDETNPPV